MPQQKNPAGSSSRAHQSPEKVPRTEATLPAVAIPADSTGQVVVYETSEDETMSVDVQAALVQLHEERERLAIERVRVMEAKLRLARAKEKSSSSDAVNTSRSRSDRDISSHALVPSIPNLVQLNPASQSEPLPVSDLPSCGGADGNALSNNGPSAIHAPGSSSEDKLSLSSLLGDIAWEDLKAGSTNEIGGTNDVNPSSPGTNPPVPDLPVAPDLPVLVGTTDTKDGPEGGNDSGATVDYAAQDDLSSDLAAAAASAAACAPTSTIGSTHEQHENAQAQGMNTDANVGSHGTQFFHIGLDSSREASPAPQIPHAPAPVLPFATSYPYGRALTPPAQGPRAPSADERQGPNNEATHPATVADPARADGTEMKAQLQQAEAGFANRLQEQYGGEVMALRLQMQQQEGTILAQHQHHETVVQEAQAAVNAQTAAAQRGAELQAQAIAYQQAEATMRARLLAEMTAMQQRMENAEAAFARNALAMQQQALELSTSQAAAEHFESQAIASERGILTLQEKAQEQQAVLLNASHQLQGDAEREQAAAQAQSQEIIGLRAAAELEVQRTRDAAHRHVQAVKQEAHAELEQQARQSRQKAESLEKEAHDNDARLREELKRVQDEAQRSVGQQQQHSSSADAHRMHEIATLQRQLGESTKRADDEANVAHNLVTRSRTLGEDLKASERKRSQSSARAERMEALIEEQGLEHKRRVEQLESSLKKLTEKLDATTTTRSVTSPAPATANTYPKNVHTLPLATSNSALAHAPTATRTARPVRSRSPSCTLTVTETRTTTDSAPQEATGTAAPARRAGGPGKRLGAGRPGREGDEDGDGNSDDGGGMGRFMHDGEAGGSKPKKEEKVRQVRVKEEVEEVEWDWWEGGHGHEDEDEDVDKVPKLADDDPDPTPPDSSSNEEEEDEDDDHGHDKGKEVSALLRIEKALKGAVGTATNKDDKAIDVLKLPDLPAPPAFRHWDQQVRVRVATLSQKRPDELYEWMLDVCYNSFNQLADTGRFKQADMKLSAALRDLIAKAGGSWVSDLFNIEEEQNHTLRKPVRGRQILHMIRQRYTHEAQMGALHTYEDILAVKAHGMTLEQFKSKWDYVLSGQVTKPAMGFLHQKLAGELRTYEQLKYDYAVYDRADVGSPDKSYHFLYQAMSRVVLRTRKAKTRDEQAKSIQTNKDIPTCPSIGKGKGKREGEEGIGKGKGKENGKSKGKGKGGNDKKSPPVGCPEGACYTYWNTRACPKGKDCQYQHVGNPNVPKPTAPAPKPKPQPKQPKATAPAPKKAACKFHAQGKCTAGKDCQWSHSAAPKQGGGEQATAPAPEPKAKTKPKKKKNAAAAAVEGEPATACVPATIAIPISCTPVKPACPVAGGAAPPGYWIVDTGSGNHLISADKLKSGWKRYLHKTDVDHFLATANGNITVNKAVGVASKALSKIIEALLLENSPSVLSVGKLVEHHGFSFIWTSKQPPLLIDPDGMGIELEVRDLVPYLSEIACTKRRVMTPALPFTAGKSSSSTGSNNEQPDATPRPPPGLEHLEVGDGCGGAPVAPDVGAELISDEPAKDDKEGKEEGAKKKYLPDPDSTEHLFTHFPAHPDCEACQRGKQ